MPGIAFGKQKEEEEEEEEEETQLQCRENCAFIAKCGCERVIIWPI